MTELEKLKHLLGHWIEHNKAHIKTYNDWSSKAESLGEEELSAILRRIAEESEKLGGLLKTAIESIK